MSVGVHLAEVDHLVTRTGDLLMPLRPAERTASEKASVAMDHINDRFGAGTIRLGVNRQHPGFFERG